MGACCETKKKTPAPATGSCCAVPSPSAPVSPDADGYWLRLGVSLVFVGLLMIVGISTNLGEQSERLHRGDPAYWWVHGGMIFAALTPVALLGGPLFAEALGTWARLRITVESLFVASAAGAFATSLMTTLRGEGEAVYYDTVPVVMVIWSVGRRVGRYSRDKAYAAVADLRKTFDIALVRLPDGTILPRPASSVTPHDLVVVSPGGAIPVDGVIVDGHGYILESAMTGEALPVSRGPGDAVSAGMWSRDGALVIRPHPGARRLDGIIAAVEDANAAPSRYQKNADRIIAWFFPAVMAVSAATFAGWWLLGHDLQAGVRNAMAVLLVACPCALGLATPIAIWSGLHKLSRLGLVSKHADLIGTLATADRIVFDKTGTLSHTDLRTEKLLFTPAFAERSARVIALLRDVQTRVNHPVARAFAALQASTFEAERLVRTSVTVVPGAGVRATVDDDSGESYSLRIGEPSLVGEDAARALDALDPQARGKRVYVTVDGVPAALAILGESFRDDAPEVLRALEKLGLKTAVLTGDASVRGVSVAGAETEAGLSPEEKADRIAAWKAAGETVVFVGDGLNDAVALTGADASLAMGEGTDLARSAAQGVLVGDRLGTLPQVIALCRDIDRTLRNNLLWSAAYNAVGITLAVSGWLTPIFAALIMVVSSTFVSWRAAKAAGVT